MLSKLEGTHLCGWVDVDGEGEGGGEATVVGVLRGRQHHLILLYLWAEGGVNSWPLGIFTSFCRGCSLHPHIEHAWNGQIKIIHGVERHIFCFPKTHILFLEILSVNKLYI